MVGIDSNRRSRAGPVRICNVMCSIYLSGAGQAIEARIAGATPQFGCWHATSGRPEAVVEGRIHPVVREQRTAAGPPGWTWLWHELVTLYKIRA